MGTEYYEAIGVAVARAFVDPSLLEKNGFEQGEAHETIEGYLCALVSVREKRNIPIAFAEKGLPGENSDISKACRASVPARVDNCGIYEIGPNAVKIK